MTEKGRISVAAENMFPVIRKWLYTEKDIFIRELVSNCVDAIVKRKAAEKGQYDDSECRITVVVDPEGKILSFTDTGIGMDADEVRRYINQVAYSGAKEFFERFSKTKDTETIIGHFGLGFYSSFMAAERVEINTKSYRPEAEAVRWISHGGVDYEMMPSPRTETGTEVTLYLDESSEEYADPVRVLEVLVKYFQYLNVPLYIVTIGDGKEEPIRVNPTYPLWLKDPKDCTNEEYLAFYHQMFADASDPLFWIHLSIDFPFRMKGILYFPRMAGTLESLEGQIRLYSRQVFIADNLKEVFPDYMLLLKGGIDLPDIPLNVSRSMLQNEDTVKRTSVYIRRKAADRINERFAQEREAYEDDWEAFCPFVKFGCLRDDKFYERVKGSLLFKTLEGCCVPVDEYIESIKPTPVVHEVEASVPKENGDDMEQDADVERVVWYTSDPASQSAYVRLYRDAGVEAVVLPHILDNHFITLLERKNERVRFVRLDGGVEAFLTCKEPMIDRKALFTAFGPAVKERMPIYVYELSVETPAIVAVSEQTRRLRDMARNFNVKDLEFPEESKLILNASDPLIKQTVRLVEEGKNQEAALIAGQIYDLARIARGPLEADEMESFISGCTGILKLMSSMMKNEQ